MNKLKTVTAGTALVATLAGCGGARSIGGESTSDKYHGRATAMARTIVNAYHNSQLHKEPGFTADYEVGDATNAFPVSITLTRKIGHIVYEAEADFTNAITKSTQGSSVKRSMVTGVTVDTYPASAKPNDTVKYDHYTEVWSPNADIYGPESDDWEVVNVHGQAPATSTDLKILVTP